MWRVWWCVIPLYVLHCSSLHTFAHNFKELSALHKSDTDLMHTIMSLLRNLLAGCHENCEVFKREGGETALGRVLHEVKGMEVLATAVLCSFSATW